MPFLFVNEDINLHHTLSKLGNSLFFFQVSVILNFVLNFDCLQNKLSAQQNNMWELFEARAINFTKIYIFLENNLMSNTFKE